MKEKEISSKKQSLELILDLFDCDFEILSSREKIEEWVDQVCQLIKMKKYGRLILERFGSQTPWGEGWSFIQFIETSSITGHCCEVTRAVYLNIFSCRSFDSEKVIQFSQKFFKAGKVKARVLER